MLGQIFAQRFLIYVSDTIFAVYKNSKIVAVTWEGIASIVNVYSNHSVALARQLLKQNGNLTVMELLSSFDSSDQNKEGIFAHSLECTL